MRWVVEGCVCIVCYSREPDVDAQNRSSTPTQLLSLYGPADHILGSRHCYQFEQVAAGALPSVQVY
jgi:hypothetical protein